MMARLAPPALILAAVALMFMGWAGKLPHEWFGLTTADLLGLAVISFIPLSLLVLLGLGVRWLWQVREGVRWVSWRLGEPAPPQQQQRRGDNVVVPFRRGG